MARQGTNLVYYDLDTTGRIFTATWDDVGYYSAHNTPSNAFQLQLFDRGGGNFDIAFIYENIGQATADLPGVARAGYSPGGGNPGGFELPGSGDVSAILQIDTNTGNTGTPGYWYFQVRGGQVIGGDGGGGGGPSTDPVIPPRPIQFSVETLGLQREGNTGETPFDVVIRRGGGDLGLESIVQWRILIDDPADLVPGQALTGTAIFPAFIASVTVPIRVVGDRVFENDDMIRFQLTQVSFGGEVWDPGVEGAVIIVNDDPATTFLFAGSQIRAEGQAGATPFDFVVLRTGDVSGASLVEWRLNLGTADSLDLLASQAVTGSLAFAPGQTQAVITIQVAGDTRVETDESFTIHLTTATTRNVVSRLDATTLGTILDDDVRQSLLVASPTAMVITEGDAGAMTFNFTLIRVGDISAALQLPYAISLPTTGGLDTGEILSPLSGMISFAAGAFQAILTVLVQGDTTPEATESFLVNVGGGVGLNSLQLTGTVLDDDKVAVGFAAALDNPASAPSDGMSSFLQRLAEGGLWSDAGLV